MNLTKFVELLRINKVRLLIAGLAVLIIIILFAIGGTKTRLIQTTSPANMAKQVSLFQPIKVSFNRALSDNEKASFNLTSNPVISGERAWSPDNKTFTLKPTALASDQLYNIFVSGLNQNYTWSFSTVSSNNITAEDQAKLQVQADKNYADWQKSLYDKFPQFDSFPIQTADYFIYYDSEQNKIFAIIYYRSTKPNQIQIDSLKRTIEQRVSGLNVDLKKYPIQYSEQKKL